MMIMRAMVRVGRPYPPMAPELHAWLTEHFAPDNASLAAWLGRDLSGWSRPALLPPARDHVRTIANV